MTVYTRPNGDDKNDRIEKPPVKSPKRAIANRNKDHEMNVLVTDWKRITRELNVEVNEFPLNGG